jgi:flagellar motor switch protein FliM
MKTISLVVDITFSEDISDDNLIKEVANNVLDSLVNTLENSWLAPTDTEAYTEKIAVSEQFTKTKLEYNVFQG